MRERTAPRARAVPLPMECTPGISRAAIPAILATTESAMVVLPCAVCKPDPPPRVSLAELSWPARRVAVSLVVGGVVDVELAPVVVSYSVMLLLWLLQLASAGDRRPAEAVGQLAEVEVAFQDPGGGVADQAEQDGAQADPEPAATTAGHKEADRKPNWRGDISHILRGCQLGGRWPSGQDGPLPLCV